MLKHFAAATLGLAVLFGATAPATAGKGGYVWANKPLYLDTYPSTAYTDRSNTYARAVKSKRKKFDPKLDFETEAVWRNLRPEWFDD